MDSSYPFRIDTNARNWSGQPSSQNEKQKRQKAKLAALLQYLKIGQLENAKQAFVALQNADSSIVNDPYLGKIYTALQNNDIHSAQKLGCLVETRSYPPNTKPAPFEKKPISQPKTPIKATSGIKIDLIA
jgi:hypothetical protein